MSRVSINRRLEALRDAAERIDPRALAIHRMRPATRMRFDLWRDECASVWSVAAARYGGDGEAFGALLDGQFKTPEPSREVRVALQLDNGPTIPADATGRDLEEIWRAMIEDDPAPKMRRR